MDFKVMRAYIRKCTSSNIFTKLIKNNTGYSSKNFFLVLVTIIGTVLLAVPAFCLIIEAWYNHTITTDLTAMAAYITAVAAVFTSVGLTKVWSEKYEHKLPGPDGKLGTDDDVVIDVSDEDYDKIVNIIHNNNDNQEQSF